MDATKRYALSPRSRAPARAFRRSRLPVRQPPAVLRPLQGDGRLSRPARRHPSRSMSTIDVFLTARKVPEKQQAAAQKATFLTAHRRSSKRWRCSVSYEVFRQGLDAPICLTWELTYGCNLRCAHCLSSSGEVREGELTTAQAKKLIDEWAAMKVFYINVGGGEPMSRPDFRRADGLRARQRHRREVQHQRHPPRRRARSTGSRVVASGSTCRSASTAPPRRRAIPFAATARSSAPRGRWSGCRRPRRQLQDQRRRSPSRTSTRWTLCTPSPRSYGAELRLTRLRPSGRGKDDVGRDASDQARSRTRNCTAGCIAHPDVLTGDSFFHLSAYGEVLDGLNMCGAGRIVCCVDPLGEVYACPFILDDSFSGGNVRDGFEHVWKTSKLFAHLREWQVGGTCQDLQRLRGSCHGGCMAVKHFTGRSTSGRAPIRTASSATATCRRQQQRLKRAADAKKQESRRSCRRCPDTPRVDRKKGSRCDESARGSVLRGGETLRHRGHRGGRAEGRARSSSRWSPPASVTATTT